MEGSFRLRRFARPSRRSNSWSRRRRSCVRLRGLNYPSRSCVPKDLIGPKRTLIVASDLQVEIPVQQFKAVIGGIESTILKIAIIAIRFIEKAEPVVAVGYINPKKISGRDFSDIERGGTYFSACIFAERIDGENRVGKIRVKAITLSCGSSCCRRNVISPSENEMEYQEPSILKNSRTCSARSSPSM